MPDAKADAPLPPLKVSDIPVNKISLWRGQTFMIVCPGCKRWRRLERRHIHGHTLWVVGSGAKWRKVPCRGSGRELVFDISARKWELMYRAAVADANKFRGSRVHRKPQPQPEPAVVQMAGDWVNERERREQVLDDAVDAYVALRRITEAVHREGRDFHSDFEAQAALEAAQARQDQAGALGFSPATIRAHARDLLAA